MQIRSIESMDQLTNLKTQYMQGTTAPLDGMWLNGFVPMADHFGIFDGDDLVGFFCVNSDGLLLQFFLNPRCTLQPANIIDSLLDADKTPAGKIHGAIASTAEPAYLSLCLDRFPKFRVHTLMYQYCSESQQGIAQDASELTVISTRQLNQAVEFAVAAIGASAEWLSGYYGNLIERQELFGTWDGDRLIATGESRRNDAYEVAVADVGMIVAESERGKGLATKILSQLVQINERQSVRSICSTEQSNAAAQKAILRAGFVANNRIIQFSV